MTMYPDSKDNFVGSQIKMQIISLSHDVHISWKSDTCHIIMADIVTYKLALIELN